MAALVKAAADAGRRVKVVGAGHSWSAIAMTDGELVSLDDMQDLLAVDRERMTVTVQAGMRLWRLNDALAEQGLALPILGSVAAQSVAGVVSTGTHGSSLRWGNLSTLVTRMRLVDGQGRVHVLGEVDPSLDGARVGLGALGVITEVTLRVVEAFGLEEHTRVLGLDEALASMLEVARDEEFVKWFWLPHTGRVAEFRYRRVDQPDPPARFARWVDEKIVNGLAFPAVLALGGSVAAAIPLINRAVRVAYFRAGTRSGRSDHMFNLAMPPVHRETEWSVPLEEGPEAAGGIARLIEERGLRVNFIQELRLVRADSGWLSPAHGRDSCHVGAYVGYGRDAEQFITGSCELMQQRGARPHWGKEMDVGRDYLARVYPQLEQFLELRRALDPTGTFDNAFLRRSFGSVADA